MEMTEIFECFTFGYSDEYPSGYVAITKENVEKLQNHGWNVSFHTDYYLNFIGADVIGLDISFGGWMDNLTAYFNTSDEYQEIVKFNDREHLDRFIQFIESAVQFSKYDK